MIEQELNKVIELALQSLYQDDKTNFQFQKTRKEFEGDVTLVVFPLTRVSKKSPEQTAEDIGQYLKENEALVNDFNVVKGFLNLSIDNSYWLKQFQIAFDSENFGCIEY